MSIDLGTVSSLVVGGRCTGCGRFVSRNESHFHSPPRKFRGRPRVHLWDEGGGCVTRCDDVEQARRLIIAEHVREYGDDRGDAERIYSVDGARVERGRWWVQPPGSDYGQLWYPIPGGKGPGITTAVVW